MKKSIVLLPLLMLGGLLHGSLGYDLIDPNKNTSYPFRDDVAKAIENSPKQDARKLMHNLVAEVEKQESKRQRIFMLANVDLDDMSVGKVSTSAVPGQELAAFAKNKKRFLKKHCTHSAVEHYKDLVLNNKKNEQAVPDEDVTSFIQCLAFDVKNRRSVIQDIGRMAGNALIESDLWEETAVAHSFAKLKHIQSTRS